MGNTIDTEKTEKTLMNNDNKKIKPMEWVGAQSAGGCVRTEAKPSNKTFTPPDRDIRPKRRTKRIKEQAADAKLVP